MSSREEKEEEKEADVRKSPAPVAEHSPDGRRVPMPQVVTRRDNSGESSPTASPPATHPSSSPRIRMSSAAETLGAVGGGSGSSGAGGAGSAPPGENEDAAWRNFCYEHPLHAATSAMLNLGGASSLSEDAAVNSVGSILVSTYEHQYYPGKGQQHHHPAHQQHHTSLNNLPPLPASVQPVHKDGKSMNELWT